MTMDTEIKLLVATKSVPTDLDNDEDGWSVYPKQSNPCISLVVRAAVKQEDTLFGYLHHLYVIGKQSNTLVVLRTLLTTIALGIFVVGIQRFHKCSFEPEIPLFLVLEGGVIIFKTCVAILSSCKRGTTEEGERNVFDTCGDISTLFLLLWTLTGSVWVFGIFSKVNMDVIGESEYCDRTVYLTSLWFLISTYCAVLTFISIVAVLSIYYIVKSDGVRKQLPYEITV